MNNVIICGLRYVETLCAVEHFLDDKYHIIGYSDINPEMNWLVGDSLGERKPFYTFEQLGSLSFDYIILPLFDEVQLNDLTEKLKNVSPCTGKGQIVVPIILNRNSLEKHQEDIVRRIRNTNEKFYGIILGMSYSFLGIDKKRLSEKFFDFSWHGRDMYYNLQLLKYAFSIGKFSDIKTAWLVFPYYYFDYDQSQSLYQYTSAQMFGVYELDDWRNAEKAKVNRDKIMNYITNYRMFGKKIFDWYHGGYTKKIFAVYQGELKSGQLSKSFHVNRSATVEENLSVFEELIKILTERGIKIVLITPPFFIDGLSEESSERLKSVRKKFHSLVKEITDKSKINIDTYDFSEIFPDNRSLFHDLEHLNANGAVLFTEKLNSLLL